MMSKKVLYTYILLLGCIPIASSQNLLDILENEQNDSIGYVPATFKMTRILLGHSTEVRNKGVLEISAFNRFWNLPTMGSRSFAADKMSTRFALEYGVSNKLSIGFGGTTLDGLFDGYLKYQLKEQSNGTVSFPVNITLFQGGSYNSRGIPNPAIADDFSDRLSFTTQFLVSRRITSNFSFQLSPTFVYKGLQFAPNDSQAFFAMGFGARYRLGAHISVASQYYANFNRIESFKTYGPFALGVNWEQGDVLLQFMITNAPQFVEDAFITQTRNNFNFKNPNLNFGFNATYVIHFKNSLKRTKKKEK